MQLGGGQFLASRGSFESLSKTLVSGQAARLGFTLAEVLVTLGIIGVVSAMTVPALMQNHQRKTYVTQLHKVYNEMSQAFVQYQNDNNALNLKEAGLRDNNAVHSFIRNYFKVVQECDTMDNCFASEYKSLTGNVLTTYDKNYKSFVLASGAAIRPMFADIAGGRIMNIGIDINGQKGPNVAGRDIFWFYVYNNGYIDDTNGANADITAPLTNEYREKLFEENCEKGIEIDGCFGKILNDNWEMTY